MTIHQINKQLPQQQQPQQQLLQQQQQLLLQQLRLRLQQQLPQQQQQEQQLVELQLQVRFFRASNFPKIGFLRFALSERYKLLLLLVPKNIKNLMPNLLFSCLNQPIS